MTILHLARPAVAIVAAALIVAAVLHMESPKSGLAVEHRTIGAAPVTVFAKAGAPPGPAVVVAHGFAGSRQLMHPIAVTLAHAGYRAVVFDFPGHGRHPEPLTGSITEETGATEVLVGATLGVLEFARTLPGSDGRVALVGHSMASDVVVRAAQRAEAVRATVAVSMFSPAVTADAPANLLVVVGAYEPPGLRQEGLRVLAQVADESPPAAGVTYGDFTAGTARRLVVAPGVEHVSVLYSEVTLTATRRWLNRAFARTAAGPTDGRGPWLALAVAGIVALGWPLAALLPRAAAAPAGAALGWKRLGKVIAVPAFVTPLVLAVVPTGFLPILVGDYLAVHFGLYGVLTWVTCLCLRSDAAPRTDIRTAAVIGGGTAVAVYAVAVLGGLLDRYFANFWLIGERLPLLFAMLLGTLPFFLAIEWATRGPAAPRGGHVAAKLAFLGSLALAVALDVESLFFLIMIVPAILIFFLVYGLFAHWAYARTRHPAVGAIGNAVGLAWALAVTFPMLGA